MVRESKQHAMRRMEQADCRNGEGWYRKAANSENDGAGNRKDDVGRQQAVKGGKAIGIKKDGVRRL